MLNNSAGVSPRVRAQVRDAISQLGYVRQRAARTVTGEQPFGIAAVVGSGGQRLFNDPTYARVLSAACTVFTQHDRPLLLTMADRQATLERYLRSRHVEGVLLIAAASGQMTASAIATRLPIVLIGRPLWQGEVDYVDVDNHAGAHQAVTHLIAQGRQSVATIAGPPDTAVGVDRLAGYRTAHQVADRMAGPVLYGDFTRASGVHAMERLMSTKPHVDAVFAASDAMAAGALHALRRAGRRVPDDVAVVGFDDLPMSAHTNPPLTTVRQPLEELGTLAAQRLLRAIEGDDDLDPDPATGLLPTSLVIRQSG